jgi:hypothetical protein
MNEADWLAGKVRGMIAYARAHASTRRRRLLACGYCRLRWSELPDERLKQFIEQIERYADGEASGALVRAYKLFDAVKDPSVRAALPRGMLAVLRSAQASAEDPPSMAFPRWEDEKMQVHLLRDLFGNPFRPITLDQSWLTPTVTQLANAAYEERILPSGQLELHRLAVLADALEEAGASGDILSHLRGPGPHVRGCFVIDRLLNRE